jgi:hypothetical protein
LAPWSLPRRNRAVTCLQEIAGISSDSERDNNCQSRMSQQEKKELGFSSKEQTGMVMIWRRPK